MNVMKLFRSLTIPGLVSAVVLSLGASLLAHDAWLEAHPPRGRVGDRSEIAVMLGNHGNHHRDFKFASKLDVTKGTLQVVSPDGQVRDALKETIDLGLGPRDGFWMLPLDLDQSGVWCVLLTSQSQHGVKRSLKRATVYVEVDADQKPTATTLTPATAVTGPKSGEVTGKGLELVPQSQVTSVVVGRPVRIRVDFDGKPLPGATVSFIPRGVVLKEGLDPEFERQTGSDGVAEWTPKSAGLVLIAVHHATPEAGDGYESTEYSSTLTVPVRGSVQKP